MKPTTDQNQEEPIECPICGGGYNHVIRVGTELDPSGDEIKVYEGTALVFERESSERHSAVRIDFDGECGHSWSLILQQHKGMMSIHARLIENAPIPVEDWKERHKTIRP